MLNLIRKQPLIFFILLTVLISWLPWYTGGQGIFVFGPSIAGVITIALVAGKYGLRELMQRAFKMEGGAEMVADCAVSVCFIDSDRPGDQSADGCKHAALYLH